MKTIFYLIIALLLYGCNKEPVSSTDIITDPWTSVYSKTYLDNDTSAYVSGYIIFGVGFYHTLELDTIDTRNADSVKCRIQAYKVNIVSPKRMRIYNDYNNILNMDFTVMPFPPIVNNTIIFEQILPSPKVKSIFTLFYLDYDFTNFGELIIKKVEIRKK